MQNKILFILGAFLLQNMLSLAHAQARWFDIEVIVFKHNVSLEDTQEQWPQPPKHEVTTTLPLLSPLLDCTPPCATARPAQLPEVINGAGWSSQGRTKRKILSSSQLKLKALFNNLKAHAAYSPLIHLGWREVVASPTRAQFYQLNAGRDFSEGIGEAQWELDGGIKVYLQHYLYIDAKLLLRRLEATSQKLVSSPEENTLALAPSGDSQTVLVQGFDEASNTVPQWENTMQLQGFAFDQLRRVRSGEIHYFDHPLMGMLIQIRRAN